MRGNGKIAFEPTSEQRAVVTALADCGLNHDEIARRVIDPTSGRSISGTTLRRYFAAELKEGKNGANAAVRASLFEMATKLRIPAAAIFWAKTQMGWKEPAQELNLHTYGELVEKAANIPRDAALKVIQGGKSES